MFGKYTYHEIIKRTIISFGTLFNNIQIRHQDGSDNDISLIKVPIAYGPIQKFLSRLDEKPDPRNRVAITLPRMSFEMTSIQYDSSRKVSTIQTFQANKTGTGPVQVYMPAPYNIGIQLSIMTKYQDDMLQIIEQILPYFQPQLNVTVDLVNSIGEKRDIPIILESISMSDDYEGDYSTRRSLVYTLNFTAKTAIFGAIADTKSPLIKKVQVDYYTNTDRANASRQLRYTAEPRPIKDYNNDATTVLAGNVDEDDVQIIVADSSSLVADTYIMINSEEMFIKSINGNTVDVLRARDNTLASVHEEGDAVNVINSADKELIEYGDEFGFDEERFDFGDGRIFSARKGIDL
jgi:hypothetical protein